MMKKALVVAILLLTGCGQSGADKQANTAINSQAFSDENPGDSSGGVEGQGEIDTPAIEASARSALATSLYDSGSAQFRKLKTSNDTGGRSTDVVCGQVNAKNRFGAYAGFQEFIAFPSDDTAIINTSRIGSRSGDFLRLYRQHCALPAEAAEFDRVEAQQQADEQRRVAESAVQETRFREKQASALRRSQAEGRCNDAYPTTMADSESSENSKLVRECIDRIKEPISSPF